MPHPQQVTSNSRADVNQRSSSEGSHQISNHSNRHSDQCQPIGNSELPIDQQDPSNSNTGQQNIPEAVHQITPENTGHRMIIRAKKGIFKSKIYNATMENEEPFTYHQAIQCEK